MPISDVQQQLLKAAGGTYSVDEVGHLLKVGPDAVRARVRDERLLAVRMGADVLLPRCQFEGGEVFAGLADVLEALGKASSHPWTVLSVLLEPLEALGDESGPRSLLDALRSGEAERAVSAATFIHATGGV